MAIANNNPFLVGRVIEVYPNQNQQGGTYPCWLASVQVEDNVITAYIKRLPPRLLLVELVCACLGRSVGLPIPCPIIADWQGIQVFGSQALDHRDLRVWLRIQDLKVEILKQFEKWCHLPGAVVFDEWVANRDRNQGNLLTDGEGNFWLIDHERAIPEGLLPSDPSPANWLAQFARATHIDDIARRSLLDAALKWLWFHSPHMHELDVQEQIGDSECLCQFLRQRVKYLERLTRLVLPLPDFESGESV